MDVLRTAVSRIERALRRARWPIVSVAATYVCSVATGIALIHAGNAFAVSQRDAVLEAAGNSRITRADVQGDALRAALLDFAGNATVGSLPKAISGFAIIFAYPQVAYQGWIGGIVSLSRDGVSRFADIRSTIYYAVTLAFQLTGFSIVVGAGVNGGLALLRPAPDYQGHKWLGLFPMESLKDFAWLYVAALPFFLIGSLWEFLSPWNL